MKLLGSKEERKKRKLSGDRVCSGFDTEKNVCWGIFNTDGHLILV